MGDYLIIFKKNDLWHKSFKLLSHLNIAIMFWMVKYGKINSITAIKNKLINLRHVVFIVEYYSFPSIFKRLFRNREF